MEATAVSYMVFAQSPVRDSPYRSAEVAQRQLANENASWHLRCEHQYYWVDGGYPLALSAPSETDPPRTRPEIRRGMEK